MDLIYVSFSLSSFSCRDSDSSELYYSEILKPLIKFLNKNPDFHFSFSFSGSEISFFKKKKNEFLKVLSELVKRNQVEIYGGAYYKPVLPLLLPSDRNGQIDLLTSEIRQATGKAPRGLCLYNDVWESSLLQTLNSCGMDYVILNETIIPENKQKYIPVQMSELGKTRLIYSYNDSLKAEFLKNETTEFVNKLRKVISKANINDSGLIANHKNIVNISLSRNELKEVLQKNLLSGILEAVKQENSGLVLSTVSEYGKINTDKIPAFIPAGICPVLKSITYKPFTQVSSGRELTTIFDFMETYSRSRALYNRMLYVSQIVNQPNKNKALQKLAREKLWEGQSGEGLVCVYKNTQERQKSYKKLMESENIIRETNEFQDSVLSFDYNSDGYNEYICRMKDYFAYISPKGGSVCELESVKITGNYADNYSRLLEFDGITDGYERGLFVDHLFNENQFQNYLNKRNADSGIFSKIFYSEVKFNAKHHEVILKASALYGKQPVSITKKYTINSSGMNIQYILTNESDSELKTKFCVESNFAHIDFSPENSGAYKVLLATDTEAREVNSEKSSVECFDSGYVSNINVAQITDETNGISFSFEPNENCSYCFYPLTFARPDFITHEQVPLGMTYVSTLFWDIQIEPGKEIEKNFNFTIFSSHKTRKKNISK